MSHEWKHECQLREAHLTMRPYFPLTIFVTNRMFLEHFGGKAGRASFR